MENYFGYIRVSTARQGERGVSLQEQREAIRQYARSNGLTVTNWFEERITAAKSGRPVFTKMLKRLRQGEARGIIIHKIDRSARNLRDWACLGELLDTGLDVRFAYESLDLKSRGGRLAADIQAVVAADYIRNLRDETLKGMYGRLKQGLFPLPAPLGYVDNGGGKPKTICPVMGPLVRRAFECYATGTYSLHQVTDEMHALGVRSRSGARVPHGGWARILRNPFYMGLICIDATNETFKGIHEPLVDPVVYDRVQRVFEGRLPKRSRVHDFTFRQLFKCQGCGNYLIGERQKGHVYYRCHTRGCRLSCLREERLDASVQEALKPLTLSAKEIRLLRTEADRLRGSRHKDRDNLLRALRLRADAIRTKLDRLTDAYIDRLLPKNAYESRRQALLREQLDIDKKIRDIESGKDRFDDALDRLLELANSPHAAYKSAKPPDKRDMLRNIFSNRAVAGKNAEFTMRKPYQALAERPTGSNGAPNRITTRTWRELVTKFVEMMERMLEDEENESRGA